MHAGNRDSAVRRYAVDTAGRSVPALYSLLTFGCCALKEQLIAFMLTDQRRFSLPIDSS
jgi:hypothetical protein